MRAFLSIPLMRAAVAVFLVAPLSGCATKGDLRAVRTEIRQLAVQQDSLLTVLQRQNRLTVDTLRSTSSQITNLQGNFSQQLRDLSEGLDRLMELAGQNSRAISGIHDQLASMGRMTRGAPLPVDDGGTDLGAVPSTSPDSIYSAALESMELGSLATARRFFQRLLDTFPNHALAPAARFHIADIYVQEGRYEEALDEFLLIRQEHPTDPKVPEGLYRAALLQIEQLDRRDDGVRNLQLVVNSYPDSDSADLAQLKLDDLGR